MNGTMKFALGALGATCLAWGTHAITGAGYIDGMEADTKAALDAGGYDGVSFEMQRDPLARIAVLDGVDDPAKRAEIEAALMASDANLAGVRWADGAESGAVAPAVADADGAADADATVGASAEQVADCQNDVNAFMESKTITFRSGSAFLPDSSLEIVDGLAEKLTACTGMSVAVGGHTDATGSAAINQSISQARADAVAEALTARGVGAARITATGYGSSQLLVEGDGANEANRRIEFTLATGE